MKRILILTIVLAFALPGTLLASGIELQEQDAESQARALAVRARLANPATLFYNPAGLAFLDGFAIAAGDTLVFPSFNYSDPNGVNPRATTVNPLVPPPHAYASFATEIHPGGRLGAGIGINYPFGLTMEWEEDFAGRNLIAESQLMIPQIMAGISYAPVKTFSFGASLVVSPASVYMRRYLGPEFGLVADDGSPIEDAQVELGGSGLGIGFTVGLQARPTDNLFLGLVYRAGMALDMTGDTHFQLPGLSDKSGFPDQSVETAFQLPDTIAFGIGTQFGAWYGEFDIDYTLWSAFEEIPLVFPDDQTGSLTQAIPEYWKDTWTFRFGNTFTLSKNLVLRAGIGFDQNPARDEHLTPMLPDSDRIFTAIGAGYRFDFGLRFDASYMLTYFLERTVNGHLCTQADPECFDEQGEFAPYNDDGSLAFAGNPFPARYENVAHLLSLTLGMEF
jgi:long-chain fatty acid transport protein